MNVISLGAGVQSTTLALMAAAGELTPTPDCAIFADTGSEPAHVYAHLQRLRSALPFPVHVVSAGNLGEQIRAQAQGLARNDARPPLYVRNADGTQGMLRRQCTHDYKIVPIERHLRGMLGLSRGQRWPTRSAITQWIGISLDEIQRCTDSRRPAIINRYPLIEQRMRRWDCLQWLRRGGHSIPGKSACTFCPYRRNDAWRDLREKDPAGWAEAVAIDETIRTAAYRSEAGSKGEYFLHHSMKPLRDVDLSTAEERGQPGFWGMQQECEGMCGT